jgi:hypothetical protein
MTRLILDRDTLARLGPLDKPLQIFDDTGHLLGFFQPLDPQDLVPTISREEIERRKQEKGGRGLAEILRDLESRHD